MLNGSLRIGRVQGVPVFAHWSLALVVFILAPNLSGALGLPLALATIAAFIATVLAHEVGHVVVARRFGVSTSKMQLWALGGTAHLNRAAPSPRAEGWIAVAGPLVSLTLGAAAIAGAVAAGHADARSLAQALAWLGVINVAIAVFNMLPGAPLDGGRLVASIRWRRHGDRDRAVGEAATAGVIIGWLIACGGLWLTLTGYPSLMLVFTGIFLTVNAKAEAMGAQLAARLRGTTVAQMTVYGLAEASGNTSVATILWQRSRLGLARVVVVGPTPTTSAGIVTEDQLWEVPEHERDNVALSTLATPIGAVARVDLDDDIADVIGHVNPLRPLVTVWKLDRLVGVVNAKALLGRLEALAPTR